MPTQPPESLVVWIHKVLADLLTVSPDAASSEAYLQNYLEFALIRAPFKPRYFLRSGINYHGQKVQHLRIGDNGRLIGWNEGGITLATGGRAKMRLAGYTIFPRTADEQNMTDTKVGGGDLQPDQFVRLEFKARGWLGKTRNLGGAQLEKDIDLLQDDRADLLVLCLSEVAHRKWRGEGSAYHAARRTGTLRFRQFLAPPELLQGVTILQRHIIFEGSGWVVSTQRTIGNPDCVMPGAEHFVTLCWRSPHYGPLMLQNV